MYLHRERFIKGYNGFHDATRFSFNSALCQRECSSRRLPYVTARTTDCCFVAGVSTFPEAQIREAETLSRAATNKRSRLNRSWRGKIDQVYSYWTPWIPFRVTKFKIELPEKYRQRYISVCRVKFSNDESNTNEKN